MTKYVNDGNHVSFFDDYYFNKPKLMREADSATFKPVGDWFGKDNNHVYFLYNIVTGAFALSFDAHYPQGNVTFHEGFRANCEMNFGKE